jgi:hypothetical protein
MFDSSLGLEELLGLVTHSHHLPLLSDHLLEEAGQEVLVLSHLRLDLPQLFEDESLDCLDLILNLGRRVDDVSHVKEPLENFLKHRSVGLHGVEGLCSIT